jgi:2-polyprenyl-6-methoxyphenol hydroxylase-like FAD-dependent oxidoreductase
MRVLICGAGIAGLTAAYRLKKGMTPTLIERSEELKADGWKLSFCEAALEVMQRMGILELVRAVQMDLHGDTIVDRDGKTIVEISGEALRLLEGGNLAVAPNKLLLILKEALGDAEFLFGDSVSRLTQGTNNTVSVEFEKNEPRTFDLVIGADGLHSRVRHLAFRRKEQQAKTSGIYECMFDVPNLLELDGRCMEQVEPGTSAGIINVPGESKAHAIFRFAGPGRNRGLTDVKAQKDLCRHEYRKMGWIVPQLLDALEAAPNFYFDLVTQIRLRRWTQDRVVLVGDAAYCPSSLTFQGASVAIVGAYVLANELAIHGADHKKAFTQYERKLRPFVHLNQQLAVGNITIMNAMRTKNPLAFWINRQQLRWIYRRVAVNAPRYAARVRRASNAITLKGYGDN